MNRKEAVVYKSTGSWYALRDGEGAFWNGRIKGKLRIDDSISSTNPVAVGDIVQFEIEDEDAKTAMIKGVTDRNNYIVRVSPHNRNHKHIIAANLDLALVIATIHSPRTSQGFIDRFLITAEAYHIPAIIIVNKTDLLDAEGKDQLAYWRAMYGPAGYEIVALTALEAGGVAPLRDVLQGKTTLFSGHSGVGKSTIINSLLPDLQIRTTEVSGWSGKGQHTTTFAEMHDLPGGGRIIDTPGVKEFGLIDFKAEELGQYFPEMRAVMASCRFNNCLHLNEPGCAVKQGVEDGSIYEDRYISYLSIMDSLDVKYR